MPTRDHIRDAASTLAHHWEQADTCGFMNRIGVERLLLAQCEAVRPVVVALILDALTGDAKHDFEAMLFDLAGVPDDE